MVWTVDFYSLVLGVFRLWCLPLIYLKYEFTQINHDINLAISTHEYRLFVDSFNKHNELCIKTAKLNEQLKYLIMVIYKFVKPALNLLVYTSMASDSQCADPYQHRYYILGHFYHTICIELNVRFGHIGRP